MLVFRLSVVIFLVSSCVFGDFSDYKQKWLEFKRTYRRQYTSSVEEERRFSIFIENQKKIFKHNQLYSLGDVTFKLKSNQFADLSHEEFVNQLLGDGIVHEPSVNEKPIEIVKSLSLPSLVDWRRNGSVTEVQNQGSCQSSYAFATAGVLEGQYQQKTNDLLKFSEQNLIDCSSGKYNNSGCAGGTVASSLKYVSDNHGIDTDNSYPYHGSLGTCQLNVVQANISIKSINHIPSGQEWLLQSAIATVGPVAVSFDATLESFQFYSSGIYYDFECSKNRGNHFGLAVGYGTEKKLGYYIVKNSFGKSWGEDGYVRMARFRSNNCGIATNAIYPTL